MTVEPSERQQVLQKRAVQILLDWHGDRATENGLHYFSYCSVCGWMRWDMSKGAPVESCSDAKVMVNAIGEFDHNQCPRCLEVSQRAPEVFLWVVNALSLYRLRDE